jgi:hypothetical protein
MSVHPPADVRGYAKTHQPGRRLPPESAQPEQPTSAPLSSAIFFPEAMKNDEITLSPHHLLHNIQHNHIIATVKVVGAAIVARENVSIAPTPTPDDVFFDAPMRPTCV